MNKEREIKLRDFKHKIKLGEIDGILWGIHFQNNKRPDKQTCEDCYDYKAGLCSGGEEPIKCFTNKKDTYEVIYK